MLSTLAAWYFATGAVFSLMGMADATFRPSKTNEGFGAAEVVIGFLLWPIVVCIIWHMVRNGELEHKD